MRPTAGFMTVEKLKTLTFEFVCPVAIHIVLFWCPSNPLVWKNSWYYKISGSWKVNVDKRSIWITTTKLANVPCDLSKFQSVSEPLRLIGDCTISYWALVFPSCSQEYIVIIQVGRIFTFIWTAIVVQTSISYILLH